MLEEPIINTVEQKNAAGTPFYSSLSEISAAFTPRPPIRANAMSESDSEASLTPSDTSSIHESDSETRSRTPPSPANFFQPPPNTASGSRTPRANPADPESGSTRADLPNERQGCADASSLSAYSLGTFIVTGVYCALWRLMNICGIAERGNDFTTLTETMIKITPGLSSLALIADVSLRIRDYQKTEKCTLKEAAYHFWEKDGVSYLLAQLIKSQVITVGFTLGDWAIKQLLGTEVSKSLMKYLLSPLASATACAIGGIPVDMSYAGFKKNWSGLNLGKNILNSLLVNFTFGAVGDGCLPIGAFSTPVGQALDCAAVGGSAGAAAAMAHYLSRIQDIMYQWCCANTEEVQTLLPPGHTRSGPDYGSARNVPEQDGESGDLTLLPC